MRVTNIPCNGNFRVTYTYGEYDETLNLTNDHLHHGTDMVISNSTVVSASEGTVIFAGWNNQGYGNLVIVRNGDYELYYAHLSKIFVHYGDKVTFTTEIGVQGQTGHATGTHLHFEVRYKCVVVNSAAYMKIPNTRGVFNSYAYAYNYPETSQNVNFAHKVGELVVYDKFYTDANTDNAHDCLSELGSWMQDYIDSINVGAKNPYRLKNGRYLKDENIKEVK